MRQTRSRELTANANDAALWSTTENAETQKMYMYKVHTNYTRQYMYLYMTNFGNNKTGNF